MTPPSLSPQATQLFLRFYLPAQGYAMLPTQQLAEIISLQGSQIVPIPDMSPAVMGVCNWRGEALWLIDLGCFLGFAPLYLQSSNQGAYHAIIIQDQKRTVGLMVEQVEQMVSCDPNEIQPSPSTPVTPELARCFQGLWFPPNSDIVLVLNSQAIIDSLTHSSVQPL